MGVRQSCQRNAGPAPHFKEKRAITPEEHQKILAAESNQEWRAFYELLWHLGGSQTDIATLCAENVDLNQKTVSYTRRKTGSLCLIHFGESVVKSFEAGRSPGPFFPCSPCGNRQIAEKPLSGVAVSRKCRASPCTPIATPGLSAHAKRAGSGLE